MSRWEMIIWNLLEYIKDVFSKDHNFTLIGSQIYYKGKWIIG